MAVKIKLGQRPATFKPIPVKFTMPDGEPGVITTTYKYRTRSEFGEILNRLFVTPSGEDRPEGDKIDFVALINKSREKANAELLDSITAWDLDYPVDAASLAQLSDELPAGSAALLAAYNAACTEGKLGN